MPRKRTLRKKTLKRLHVLFSLLSACTGTYLWLEPKWRKFRKNRGMT